VLDSKKSYSIDQCQISGSKNLDSILFLGYMPPVNKLIPVGEVLKQQPSYPTEIFFSQTSYLMQLGYIVDPKILFPKEYPYTSSTTKILRDNFKNLYIELSKNFDIMEDDLVIDIGSNDGNLLSNFLNKHRVLGITPEKIGEIAISKGISTILDYFNDKVVNKILEKYGKAKIITATNVFAHMDNIHEKLHLIKKILKEDGIFVTESHYLVTLLKKIQYDTIYHEHLRYYSLNSLKYLFARHGLDIIKVSMVPTHGGSIRVYAANRGRYKAESNIKKMLKDELDNLSLSELEKFKKKVILSKLKLYKYLYKLKKENSIIYGIGAPSRASILVNYVGIDYGIIDCILEVEGSYKIGFYLPGTTIPIKDEKLIFSNPPDYALILSWHIADDLISVLRSKGYKGKFIVPLPEPIVI
tara:strand:+ start:2792 stop:4030 length:1239 start_codon:yes stop_codon:yes gene_type:complete